MARRLCSVLGALFFFSAVVGCTPAPRPAGEQPDVAPSRFEKGVVDFPDWRNDNGWNTHREGDTSRNPYRDNAGEGWDNWEGYNKNVTPFLQDDGIHFDVNSDGVMDGNQRGRNSTPLIKDRKLNWFRG